LLLITLYYMENSKKELDVKNKHTVLLGLITLLVLPVLLVVGCAPAPAPEPETAPDPFTVVWGPDKEQVVTLTGDSAGHVAGKTSEFTLLLGNISSETWGGEYIVQLLDSDGIVMEIARKTFNVPAGLETQVEIPVQFDDALDGPYGLSLYIPTREAQSVHTIWIGEKSAVNAGPWPSLASHPWLWPESAALNEETARQKAEEFVKNSSTFVFDGMENSLELVETLYPDIENAWQFVYHFESRQAGYGDRTGEMLAQVITPHEAIITVEQGEIKTAIMDGKWDMVNQQMIDDVEDIEITLAPIHEVEVVIMESFPVQVGVHIKGGLSDGCTTFHDAVVTREGDTVNIEVTVQRPGDAICTQVYGFFEKNLNLGSEFTAGTTYNLKVNDYTTTFEIS